jgi:uncharacterized protein
MAGVYCHDLVNFPKDHPERSQASKMATEIAEELLLRSDFSLDAIKKIKQIVLEHSFSIGLRPTTLEASILQDADRLDTLGAIGILRCASVNTQMKSHFYDVEDPKALNRELNDKKFMIDHYFVKIFKLPALMNTEKAKQMAEERVIFMKVFLDTLMIEIN